MVDGIALSPFQQRVLAIPEEYDIFLGGGRGGSKSYAIALLAMRHAEQYGIRARIAYLRQTYKGVADFEHICQELFGVIYGQDARYNASEHVWRFPNGAYMELGQLEGPGDYAKFQGRSFTLLLIDEAGQYASPELLDRLRSNLRGPKAMPIRLVMAANPGDVGHHWLSTRYVFAAAPWQPFREPASQRRWVYAPSVIIDNPFIDQEAYRAQLESACPGDPELLRAWLEGDWAVARGAYFAGCLDEVSNAVDPPAAQPYGWDLFLAHDFGSAAPSVTYVCAKSPGTEFEGRWYPRDSIVLIDELATNDPNNLNKGLYWTVPKLADAIHEMCDRWEMRSEGAADDAIFAQSGHNTGSISDEFQRAGIRFYPAKKARRITGWQVMRRLLDDAGKPDVPGLYISRACEYFWATVPYLARDPKRVEDVDSRGPDHAADAVRYGCLWHRPVFKVVDLLSGRTIEEFN